MADKILDNLSKRSSLSSTVSDYEIESTSAKKGSNRSLLIPTKRYFDPVRHCIQGNHPEGRKKSLKAKSSRPWYHKLSAPRH